MISRWFSFLNEVSRLQCGSMWCSFFSPLLTSLRKENHLETLQDEGELIRIRIVTIQKLCQLMKGLQIYIHIIWVMCRERTTTRKVTRPRPVLAGPWPASTTWSLW